VISNSDASWWRLATRAAERPFEGISDRESAAIKSRRRNRRDRVIAIAGRGSTDARPAMAQAWRSKIAQPAVVRK